MKPELLESLKKLNETIVEAKAKLLAESKNVFVEAVKHLFETYPILEIFSWNQYTPYFNDGEPCFFSVNTYSLEINKKDYVCEWELKKALDDRLHGIISNDKYIELETQKAITDDIIELLKTIGEDNLQLMFGDHAKVIVTKDSIVAEEYDHE